MSTTSTPAADQQKIMLKGVRLSYPTLFVPKIPKGSTEEKYSATFILDKKVHAELIKKIEAMIPRIALTEFKKRVTLKHCCLHDGNEQPDTDGYGDDVMFIRSSCKKNRRPSVIDADKSPLTEADPRPYAGCYVNALVRLYAFKHDTGGYQVNASLLAVQFVKDGEPFGAAPVDTDAEFDDESGATDADL